jgi:hypothetical protein
VLAAAVAVLGASLFGEQAPESFREFDRAFITMFRIAGVSVRRESEYG